MNHCKHNKFFVSFGLWLLLASAASAELPVPTMAEDEAIRSASAPGLSIRIRDVNELEAPPPPEPPLEITEPTLSVPEIAANSEWWQGTSAQTYLALTSGISRGVSSLAIRNLTIRALLDEPVLTDAPPEILAARSDALLRLGQTTHAKRLLREVPKAARQPSHAETLFLFKVVRADPKQDRKPFCDEATAQLEARASPLWQRWVVLCQALSGEKDKAQLGLDLLEEQNEYSEFYHKVAQSIMSKTPLTSLPEMVYLEQAAWLLFTGNSAYLRQQSVVPLALVSLLPESQLSPEWQTLKQRYGLPETTYAEPMTANALPEMSIAELAKTNPRLAFLAYGLRETLGIASDASEEAALDAVQYKAEQIVASPRWRKQLTQAAAAQHAGEVILLLAGLFSESLSHYASEDIIAAVAALKQVGLAVEAQNLAAEALGAS